MCRIAVIEMLEDRRLLAATYYVSATGNDNAKGTSIATAWKSIARVNRADLNAGDKVLFEGGKTFNAAGSGGSNVISNPGFESGLTGWSDTLGGSSANASASSDSVHSGTSAIKLSGSGAAIRAQDVTSSLKADQTYMMSAWTRATNIGTGDRRVGVTFYLGGAQIASYYGGFRSSSFAQQTWEFVSPPKFDKAVVWVSRKGDSSTFYVDDLSLSSVANGLIFDESDSGTAVSPVIIASYGKGKATIDAGDSGGIFGDNVSGISIQNLNVRGSWSAVAGSGNNAGVGIDFVNTRNDSSKLYFITVEKCDVRGFRWAGVRVGGWSGKAGFNTALITDTIAAGNGDCGIMIHGSFDASSNGYSNEKIYVARCKTYVNYGIPNKWANSGSGIEMVDTKNGTVERCESYANGALSDYNNGGPVGIWSFDSTKITLQYNESYGNMTKSTRDGAGFDLDGGVTSSVVQYNYSHDNDGAGYLLAQFTGMRSWGNNFVRYNISQNDGRDNAYGALTLTGGPGPSNVAIENNVFFMDSSSSGSPSGVRAKFAGSGVAIRNNIFVTRNAVTLADVDSTASGISFNGNDWWSSGSIFKVRFAGKTYSSLIDWRNATGKERSGSSATGLSVDPMLVSIGSAPTIGDPYRFGSLTQYKPKVGSPMINAGAVLDAPFASYTPATVDFFGRSLSDSRRDLGVSEGT